MSGGAYKPLSDAELKQVFDSALQILEELGMGQATPEFKEVITKAGGSYTEENDRLLFPRDLVLGAIDTAAKEFRLYNFSGDGYLTIGGDRVYFSTGGAAVSMLDHETQRFRQSTVSDLYDIARLLDTLDNVHLCIRPVVTRDMEASRDVDLNTAYAMMCGTTKPIGTSMFQPEQVHEVATMLDIAAGGEGEFRKRPFCQANNTFVVPPLRFAEDSALCMAEQVRTGMPINLLSAGQAGATSPAFLAGSLVQALAECLAALTVVNTMSPGHPCIMGLWPFVSDLRTGAMTGGSGEEAVLNAAAAQVANYLGLPSGVAAGMSDSKLADAQAGHEKALTVGLAANAGSNIVYESCGMLASIMAFSHEMAVIDNDMLAAINRTVRGVDINEQSMSVEAMREVIFGAGHFLGHPDTLNIMQSEYTYPEVGDRLSQDDWVDAGGLVAVDRAHDYVVRTLAEHHPQHIDAATDAKIREAFPITLDRPIG